MTQWEAAVNRHRQWRANSPVESLIRPLEPEERDAEFEDQVGLGPLLWYDDESNYAGVYDHGPLEGLVFVYVHDDPPPVPRFESADAFVDRLILDDDAVADLWSVHDLVDQVTPRPELALRLLTAADHDDDDASIQAIQTALALVPSTQPPADLLDELARILRDHDGLYAWQDLPPLLTQHNWRGQGQAITEALRRVKKGYLAETINAIRPVLDSALTADTKR